MRHDVLSVILGGGKGTRLSPLTDSRAKPAVPFGGKYRLVDIPISNSINAGLRRIYVLTQFNSASLHLHIDRTYNFDSFSRDFCTILAAEQNKDKEEWYMGTADAVRKNLTHFRIQDPSYYLILSGDQLYRMDLASFLKEHIDSGAHATIAATPVNRQEASQLGILQTDSSGEIKSFLEKPGPDANIQEYQLPAPAGKANQEETYLASMGIYIFNARVMEKALDNDLKDFGKEIIPRKILGKVNTRAYVYRGYWEDIGTIQSFYQANLELASPMPRFNLYDAKSPLYTHRRDLPPSKIHSCTLQNTLTSEGSIMSHASLNSCLVGIRTIIDSGVELDQVYAMGSDFYEDEQEIAANKERGIPHYGIGEGTVIRRAIIDKNTRIGRGCRLGVHDGERPDAQGEGWALREGILIIQKGVIIPDGTVI